LIFFYWYCQRVFRAEHVSIELPAFLAIVIYVLFVFAGLVITMTYLGNAVWKFGWKRLAPAWVIMIATLPAIITYGTIYDLYMQRAFVRITDDTYMYRVARVWSENLEVTGLESEGYDFVFSFEPVYVYDRSTEDSFGYAYTINDVYVDVIHTDGSVKTMVLPKLDKGGCRTVSIGGLKSVR